MVALTRGDKGSAGKFNEEFPRFLVVVAKAGIGLYMLLFRR